LGDQRESVAGVNLDEEAANMAKAQKAYQAAARVMTAYDDLLDLVINRMGLVGR
jgi:flagellar hook-associated protein 1 FlgK